MITIQYNHSIFFNTFITAGLQLLRVSRRSMNKLLQRRVWRSSKDLICSLCPQVQNISKWCYKAGFSTSNTTLWYFVTVVRELCSSNIVVRYCEVMISNAHAPVSIKIINTQWTWLLSCLEHILAFRLRRAQMSQTSQLVEMFRTQNCGTRVVSIPAWNCSKGHFPISS